MNLKPAICTHCGATLSVDPDMDAVICQYCNSPFIVEKGVEKFAEIYISTATIQAENIILSGKDKDFEIVAGKLRSYSGDSTEVVIPDHVREIGAYAFQNMGIETVRMSDNVESIEQSAFSGCKYLRKIILSKNLKFIGDFAFEYCCSLKEVILPRLFNHNIDIRYAIFLHCSSLTKINLPENITYISDDCFRGCTGLSEIKIPEGVTTIKGAAFSDCNSLKEVSFPKSVKSIDEHAFTRCSNLRKVFLPNSIEEIGRNCFYDCQNLVEISIEEGFHAKTTKEFGCYDGVFAKCNSLKKINLPKGIYPDSFFCNCNGIQEVVFSGNVDLSNRGTIFSLCDNLSDIKPTWVLEKWPGCFDGKKIDEKKKEKEKEKNEMINKQRIKEGKCRHCGGEFSGLFTKKCLCCGKQKDY